MSEKRESDRSRRGELVRRAAVPVAGAVGGAAAAAPMAIAMKALKPLAPSTRWQSLPPRQIATRLFRRLGVGRDGGGNVATAAGHVGYSIAAGALYPLARPLLPGSSPLLKGALFGVGLWGAGYLGWVPAVGLLRPATRESTARNAMNIAAHVVFGTTTALVSERVLRSANGRFRAQGDGRDRAGDARERAGDGREGIHSEGQGEEAAGA